MENKKMSCWDFVFSSVKTHIDELVRQADRYTKDMNEDFEHFFCWYAEDMYKTQRELSCYRVENIKPVDPLLYSQLIHQKNIGFMKRKMHFNPGQF